VERVDRAFKGFFLRLSAGEKPGYPRFKPASRYNSFTLKQAGWKLEGNRFTVNKIGTFRVKLHRPVEGEIRSITVGRSFSGKWHVCFSCEIATPAPLPETGSEIGIDMGCESFLTDSRNRRIENPRFLKKSEKLLAKRQKVLSRRRKGSKGWREQKKLVSRTHERTADRRRDFHFKTAKRLVEENDVIYIEGMNSWNSWSGLNRSMRDAGWFSFFRILRFKAEEAGREVVKVPAKNTTQRCSSCGETVNMELSERVHNCPFCGFTAGRDYNAALNIHRLGASLRVQELAREAPCGSTG
jgi:putative transposase